MLNQGLNLMLTGMGTVFSFLVILWISVSLMGAVVRKLNELFPEEIAVPAKAMVKANDDTEIAIALAMAKYKK